VPWQFPGGGVEVVAADVFEAGWGEWVDWGEGGKGAYARMKLMASWVWSGVVFGILAGEGASGR